MYVLSSIFCLLNMYWYKILHYCYGTVIVSLYVIVGINKHLCFIIYIWCLFMFQIYKVCFVFRTFNCTKLFQYLYMNAAKCKINVFYCLCGCFTFLSKKSLIANKIFLLKKFWQILFLLKKQRLISPVFEIPNQYLWPYCVCLNNEKRLKVPSNIPVYFNEYYLS